MDYSPYMVRGDGYLSRRNIISIDVESNGLYGQPFCVGAVELDWGGRVIDKFLGRCPIDEVEDDWVLENVIPALEGVKQSHDDLEKMEEDFISWMVDAIARNENPIILVDVGFPVDCRFLYGAMSNASERVRKNYSPYPLIDLVSVLAGAGFNPGMKRTELAAPLIIDEGEDHHPLWDAEVSGLCLIQAIRFIEKRNG